MRQKKSSVVLANELFDTFLHRIFERAMDDGLIKKIPDPIEVVEMCHILPTKPPPVLPPGAPERRVRSSEPPIIAKFTTRNYKYILHKYKKSVLSEYEAENNIKIEIYDDLTKANNDCLKFLKSDENSLLVEKAFVLSGKIKYVLKSNTEKLLTVANPFTRDLSLLNK